MAFVPDFAVSQLLGNNSDIIVTDTHTGVDALVTQRRVYLQTSTASFLVPAGILTSYTPWALVDTSITLDVLLKDMALSIKVDWLDVNNVVRHTKNAPFDFTQYSEEFYYGLTQNQAADYTILQDKDYWLNKLILRVQINDSENAVAIGSNISAAQAALNRADYMMQHEANFF